MLNKKILIPSAFVVPALGSFYIVYVEYGLEATIVIGLMVIIILALSLITGKWLG